jgi:hypothetical protein
LVDGGVGLTGWVARRAVDSLAGMGNAHRCGKHVVLANPSAAIPVWMECAVHRFTPMQVTRRFDDIVLLEFTHEETLQLGWIVEHGMLF